MPVVLTQVVVVPGRRATARDAGMVTAETAVVLPVLLVVLAAAVWVLAAVAGQLRCVDAARAAARAAARGDAPPAVTAAAREVAPAGARVQVQVSGTQVRVLVRAEVRPFGPVAGRLPAVLVAGRAVALVEGP
jgi:Flp pilus assembly protein TadG